VFISFDKNIKKQLCELYLISLDISDLGVSIKIIISLAFIKSENLDAAVDALGQYLDEYFHNLLEW